MPKPHRAFAAISVLTAMTLCLIFLPGFAPKINVVSIGDSWAEGWCDEMQTTILLHGVAVDVYNKGIPGSSATLWAAPGALTDVGLLLFQHPEIDWAVVSMGGNDLLDGYLLQGYGDGVFPIIEASVRTVIDQLVAFRPDLKIAYNGYDFPNFEHSDFCVVMGLTMLGGITYDKNVLFSRLTEIAQNIAADYPQVTAVDLLGTLQLTGGVPNPPNYWLPSPAQFFPEDDCIHPTNGGYYPIMETIYEGFFGPLNGGGDDTGDDTITPDDDTVTPDDDTGSDDTGTDDSGDDTVTPDDDSLLDDSSDDSADDTATADDDDADDAADDDWHDDDAGDDSAVDDDADDDTVVTPSAGDDDSGKGCGC